MRCLKQQVEGAEIHYLTKPGFASFLEPNPYIDKVHVLNEDIKKSIEVLEEENFDHIIDLHNNLRSMRFKKALRMPALAFNKLNVEKWLLCNWGINRMPNKHIVDRYLDTTHYFDVENDNKGLDYFIPEKDEVKKESLPENFRNGYIGLVIGTQHDTKKLQMHQLEGIIKQIDLPVVILGGPEDAEKGNRLAALRPEMVFNAAGGFNINQSSSLVKQARLIIAHDTGLMHIAAAFKKKIISVWGNTVPEFGMYPYLADEQSTMFEVKGLKCRPCSKIGYDKCPKKHFKCMNDQDLEGLVLKARDLYNSN